MSVGDGGRCDRSSHHLPLADITLLELVSETAHEDDLLLTALGR